MERRFVTFLVLSFTILMGYSWLMREWFPPPKKQPAAVEAKDADVARGAKDAKAAEKPKEQPGETKTAAAKKPEAETKKFDAETKKPAPTMVAAEPEPPEQLISLGSADDTDANPYRMLVTLTNKGAAVARIELSRKEYRDVDNRSGYLGHLGTELNDDDTCRVRVVGPGTPAADAGLKPGDIITAIGNVQVRNHITLESALKRTWPKQKVSISITRDGEPKTLDPTRLRRRPLEVIKPENDDPLSMLLSLQQFDDSRLVDEEIKDESDPEKLEKNRDAAVRRELDGVRLRTANWKLADSGADFAKFTRVLPEKGLEIVKTYRLVKTPDDKAADAAFPAYHLEFEVEIRNIGSEPHKVAYRLDGPNGLPTEGKWYATRVTRSGGSGLRDFIISFGGGTPGMVGASTVATGKIPPPWQDESLTFIGVDAQYFSVVLMPHREKNSEVWFDRLLPIGVGKADPQNPLLTNTSCRLIGKAREIKPGESLVNSFKIFAGPKKPAILENPAYNLGELVYFGWPIFAWVAVPLTVVLHSFYAVIPNYGIAIILLTIFVRGCMFPLSRKQALGAAKMQELQPEIKRIQEKYKSNVEAKTKAQQELFKKHNYNPLSGCLPVFIQLPIFIGLYRTLMVAIELRDAPLLSHSIRWCSNLAAPDMLFDWRGFMPDMVNQAQGIFGLGPYFNLLPILTIILFIWQQKMFMPPAADEQAAMQQKIMQYMMIFMGLMFFKVASGLCIYFIASSLWGMAERKFLPKAPTPPPQSETRAEAKARRK